MDTHTRIFERMAEELTKGDYANRLVIIMYAFAKWSRIPSQAV